MSNKNKENGSKGQLHVGIIGAGFSGLRCADILLRHGVKVTILEARNRLGGRVAQSEHFGGVEVDLGPNWIHGTKNNPILEIARKAGTTLHSLDEREAIFDSDGILIDPAEAGIYTSLFWDVLLADAFEYSKSQGPVIPAERSLYDFFVDKVQEMFQHEPSETVAAEKRATLLRITKMWGAYVGAPVEKQSLRFLWLEWSLDGENLFVAGTYGKILEEVARNATANADIKLGYDVVEINTGHNSSGIQPSVKSSTGSTLAFDEIVVTTPLGWLKLHQNAFQPVLPPRLSEGIQNVSYGCLDKVYITFPSAFWEVTMATSSKLPHGVAHDGGDANGTKLACPVTTPSGKHARLSFAGFTQWLEPSYALDSNPERWRQECMNLAALPPSSAHPTLLFYIFGPVSRHIADIASSAVDKTELHTELVEFFKPYYSRLPNYDASDPECVPKAILTTTWVNDKFAGYGSYANFQVGIENADQDVEAMRRGVPERNLWFAGEHTAPFDAIGTSTGAYLSGEHLAHRILETREIIT